LIAQLQGQDSVSGDAFGLGETAIAGGTVVVGAPGHGGGRAYVFSDSPTGWHQTAELVGSDTVAGDRFGLAVAISGGTIAVTSEAQGPTYVGGHVYVFSATSTGWVQTAELAQSTRESGFYAEPTVSISGGTIAAAWANAQGTVLVDIFSHLHSGWTRTAELRGPSLRLNHWGSATVAMSGPIVAIGSNGTGGAWIYTLVSDRWSRTAILRRGSPGLDVAMSGSTLVLGGYPSAFFKGSTSYIYSETLTGWEFVGSFAPPAGGIFTEPAVSGPTIVATVEGGGGGASTGVFILKKTPDGWRFITNRRGDPRNFQYTTGGAPAVSADTAVIGGDEWVYLVHV
jgi:hypothetical protein